MADDFLTDSGLRNRRRALKRAAKMSEADIDAQVRSSVSRRGTVRKTDDGVEVIRRDVRPPDSRTPDTAPPPRDRVPSGEPQPSVPEGFRFTLSESEIRDDVGLRFAPSYGDLFQSGRAAGELELERRTGKEFGLEDVVAEPLEDINSVAIKLRDDAVIGDQ